MLPTELWANIISWADSTDDAWSLTGVCSSALRCRKDISVLARVLVNCFGCARALTTSISQLPDSEAAAAVQWILSTFLGDLAHAQQAHAYSCALDAAAAHGSNQTLWVLLAHVADQTKPWLDVDDAASTRQDGYTPLMLAVEGGHIDAAVSLVRAGASCTKSLDWDAAGIDQGTALSIAIDNDDAQMLRALVGATTSSRHVIFSKVVDSGAPIPLLMYAVDCAAADDLVEYLLSLGGEELAKACDTEGNTSLHCCARASHAALLLRHGATIDARNAKGETPLMSVRDDGVVEILLRTGASVHQRDNFGRSVLMHAARLGSADVVRRIIAHHSKISPAQSHEFLDATDAAGMTALMHAVHPWENVDAIHVLAAAGADVNLRSGLGYTALSMVASRAYSPKAAALVRALISEGARVREQDCVIDFAERCVDLAAYRMESNTGVRAEDVSALSDEGDRDDDDDDVLFENAHALVRNLYIASYRRACRVLGLLKKAQRLL